MNIKVVTAKKEPRVDSRDLAKALGNKHKSTISQIERYSDELKSFGVLAFEIAKPTTAGGRPERYALLNEDQAIFLLTLARNSSRVVPLKISLVVAFGEARARAQVSQSQYLPCYHALHEQVSALARRARECGSKTPEGLFHINVNRRSTKSSAFPTDHVISYLSRYFCF